MTINTNKNNTLFVESTDNLVPQYQPSLGCMWGIWFRESSASSILKNPKEGVIWWQGPPDAKELVFFLEDLTLQIFLKGLIWRRRFSVFSCFCNKILIHFSHIQSRFWPNLSLPNQLLTYLKVNRNNVQPFNHSEFDLGIRLFPDTFSEGRYVVTKPVRYKN